jgi:hypothetical protein
MFGHTATITLIRSLGGGNTSASGGGYGADISSALSLFFQGTDLGFGLFLGTEWSRRWARHVSTYHLCFIGGVPDAEFFPPSGRRNGLPDNRVLRRETR